MQYCKLNFEINRHQKSYIRSTKLQNLPCSVLLKVLIWNYRTWFLNFFCIIEIESFNLKLLKLKTVSLQITSQLVRLQWCWRQSRGWQIETLVTHLRCWSRICDVDNIVTNLTLASTSLLSIYELNCHQKDGKKW